MNYLSALLKQKRKLFHTADLALLWKIKNKNTLYTTIKRYVKKGVLHRIHKGFYSTQPLSKIDPVELGVAYVHEYAYLSTESVLSQKGIINQYSPAVTLISARSRRFSLVGKDYIVRGMKPELLHNDTGIELSDKEYKVASAERAVIDMLYYNPRFHFDNKSRFDAGMVDKIKKGLTKDEKPYATTGKS